MPVDISTLMLMLLAILAAVALAAWLLWLRASSPGSTPIPSGIVASSADKFCDPAASLAEEPAAATVEAPTRDDSPPRPIFLFEAPHTTPEAQQELVRSLFRQVIPAVAEGDVRLVAVARIPGYKTKVALKDVGEVDWMAACGDKVDQYLQDVADQLPEEQVDLIRWSDEVEELLENSLQPLPLEQIVLCEAIRRAIVLVDETCLRDWTTQQTDDVRLASRISNWEIAVLTSRQLDHMIESAIKDLSELDGIGAQLAQSLAEQGCLWRRDLARLQPQALASLGNLSSSQAMAIVELAAADAN